MGNLLLQRRAGLTFFSRVLVLGGALRLCEGNPKALAGLNRLVEHFSEKSIVFRDLSPADRFLDLVSTPQLSSRLATVHIKIDGDVGAQALAEGLVAYRRLPLTINLFEESVDLFLEALDRCEADFLNLTTNFMDLSGDDVSRVLASEKISTWGATCFNPAAARAGSMDKACAGRLMLCVDDRGDVFGCQAMMETGVGALGNLADSDQLAEVIDQSPLADWHHQGPEIDDDLLEQSHGDVCVADIATIVRLIEAAA